MLMLDEINYSTSMYIGETTQGVPMPVFFDTHTPVFNNKPPGILVTGAPGSGKTFFALTVTALSALLGKTTVVIDPKGDFLSLIYLKKQLGNINIWNLGPSGAKGRAGLLDPFYMAPERNDRITLVLEVIDLFVGGITGEERIALSPIIKDVADSPTPSLLKVVEELRGSEKLAARDLGEKLDLISQDPSARICFAPGRKDRDAISIESGLTIITLAGMALPVTEEEAKATSKGRLISGLLFLVTDYLRRVIENDNAASPKSVVIDEGWAIISSPQGARVVQSVALLGRSKGVSLTIITQNSSHLRHLDIENTISTRFAFATAKKEAANIVIDMDLPEGEHFEDVLVGLKKGECLMQDYRRRAATVQITRWREDWVKTFNTNPYEKARDQAARRQQAEAQGA